VHVYASFEVHVYLRINGGQLKSNPGAFTHTIIITHHRMSKVGAGNYLLRLLHMPYFEETEASGKRDPNFLQHFTRFLPCIVILRVKSHCARTKKTERFVALHTCCQQRIKLDCAPRGGGEEGEMMRCN
jgi:hypothetical protein